MKRYCHYILFLSTKKKKKKKKGLYQCRLLFEFSIMINRNYYDIGLILTVIVIIIVIMNTYSLICMSF